MIGRNHLNARFSHKSLLKKHVASVHEKNKQFKCEICEKPFYQKGLLKRHISTVHEERRAIKINLQKIFELTFVDINIAEN